MSDANMSGCAMKCWIAAAAIGLLVLILLTGMGDLSFIAGLFMALLTAGLTGLLFNWLFCAPVPSMSDRPRTKAQQAADAATEKSTSSPVSSAPASAAPSPAPTPAPAAAASSATAGGADGDVAENPAVADGAAGGEATDLTEDTPEGGDSAVHTTGSDPVADAAAADGTAGAGSANPAAAAAVTGASIIKPSQPLAGQAELSTRKGSWRYEGQRAGAVEGASVADIVAAEEATDTGASQADATGSVSDATDSDATPAPGAAGASEAQATPDAMDDAGPGEKPAGLSGPRDGSADNLKEIKGVGPKLEKMLNEMGFYHFDQIANWTEAEVAWVNQNLAGFKGRATRDNWIDQAKVLASGGETEFSARVDKGEVY